MAVDPVKTLPNTNSSGAQWIEWHVALKKAFGKKEANTLFLMAWEKRHAEGNLLTGSKANTVELRNYLEKQGITISGEGALDYASDAWDDTENFFSSAFGVGKTVGIILLVIILVPVAILLINVARNPKLIVDGFKAYSGR